MCVSVYVKVGSEQYFSDCLLMVLTPEHERRCTAGAKVRVPGGCSFCSVPSNCIAWCKTELVRLCEWKYVISEEQCGCSCVEFPFNKPAFFSAV